MPIQAAATPPIEFPTLSANNNRPSTRSPHFRRRIPKKSVEVAGGGNAKHLNAEKTETKMECDGMKADTLDMPTSKNTGTPTTMIHCDDKLSTPTAAVIPPPSGNNTPFRKNPFKNPFIRSAPARLICNFEESILNGRLVPTNIVNGYLIIPKPVNYLIIIFIGIIFN
jgi:hypothetical protein